MNRIGNNLRNNIGFLLNATVVVAGASRCDISSARSPQLSVSLDYLARRISLMRASELYGLTPNTSEHIGMLFPHPVTRPGSLNKSQQKQ